MVVPVAHSLRLSLQDDGVSAELGLWLSGFTDGEGCFSISRQPNGAYRCSFIIKLRADDRPLLEALRSELGFGELYQAIRGRNHPQTSWTVSKKADCLTLVDIFTAYPLRSKKRRDFEIWAQAVSLWASVQPGEAATWALIGELYDELRAVRAYPELAGGAGCL